MKKNILGRNWAFVMYPESMPEDWYDRLQATGLPFAISPLHDKDLDATGEEKKPHYHVICYYENRTSFNQVKANVCDLVNGTIPIKLESMSGMYRYHLHLDNPDKFQYDDRDRTFINGFEVGKVNALTTTQISTILRALQTVIIDYSFTEYSDLMDYLLDNDYMEMWDVARMHTLFLATYIKSRRFKTKAEEINNKYKEIISEEGTSHNECYVELSKFFFRF